MGAILAFSLIVVSLLAELGGCLADLAGLDYAMLIPVEIVAGTTILLLALGGMGSGKLWGIKFFRVMTRVATGIYLATVVYGLYVWFRPASGDATLATVILVIAIIQLPLFFVIYRALARVRWLDPKSLPHEWEPPAALSHSRTIRGIQKWDLILRSLMALGLALRYYVGLVTSNWVGEWLASGSVLREAVALIAIPGPFLFIGIILWLTRRARPRRTCPSE
jgi:hypothetical protein